MSTEIIQAEPQSESLFEIISKAATDKSIPVERMIALFELQERLMQKEAEIALNLALAKLEPEIQALTKSKEGAKTKEGAVKFWYTPYEKIDAMLRPLLRKFGLSLSFTTEPYDGKPWSVVTVTEITKGGTKKAMIPYAPDSNTQLNTPQQIASGVSYAKRHLVVLLFNLVTEGADDDAAFAGAIAPEQIGKIERGLVEGKIDKTKFLQYLEKQFGVKEIALIPASGFDTVAKLLQQKKEQK